MVISKKKKKRSSPKFGLLFLAVPHHHLSKFPDFAQIFHITARKTMVLPKYFLLTARKILILPKSSKLGGAIAPPAPPAGTAMLIMITHLSVWPKKKFYAGCPSCRNPPHLFGLGTGIKRHRNMPPMAGFSQNHSDL